MPMMAMVGMVVRSPTVLVGWLYHLFNSAVIGALFGWVLGRRVRGYGSGPLWGLAYGLLWWVLGGLILMPVLLGQAGVVESTCPATGTPIRVETTPEAVLRVEPPGAVVSEVRPEHKVRDVRAAICSLGHIFRSREAAAPWLAAYPEGQLNSVADDFALHRRILEELGWAAGRGGPR